MAGKFSHVNIRVADAARSIVFYRALGFDVVGTAILAPGYYMIYVGDAEQADISIELVVNETAGDDYDRSPGAGHVGVVVDDLEAVLAGLSQLGIHPEGPPTHPAGRQDLPLIAFVRDPDGVRVELIEGRFATPQDPADPSIQIALERR